MLSARRISVPKSDLFGLRIATYVNWPGFSLGYKGLNVTHIITLAKDLLKLSRLIGGKRKICIVYCIGTLSLGTLSLPAAVIVNLGGAEPFAVLGGSTVTSTGPTIVNGNLGVSPGNAITGFPPGIVNGTIHSADGIAIAAKTALTAAFNSAAGQTCIANLTGQDLGGLTLTPGVYCFDSSAQLTGILTLDAQSNLNPVYIFQIGSTLTTASNSSVSFTGGRIYWQVGRSATLGTTTAFAGNILAAESITLTTNATIRCGRALASSGAVTMDSNTVSINAGCETISSPGSSSSSSSSGGPAIPDPGTATLLGLGLFISLIAHGRSRSNKLH